MRSAILVLLALAAMPLVAADGPTASVSTFTEASSCRSAQTWSSSSGEIYGSPTPTPVPIGTDNGTGNATDNGTSPPPADPVPVGGWYDATGSSSSDCSSRSDIVDAQASDDSGSLASASVGGGNQTSWNDTYGYDGSWYDDGGHQSSSYGQSDRSAYSSSDARGADAQVLGADAGESSGCAQADDHSSSSQGSSSGSAWGSSSSQKSDSNSDARSDRCGDTVHATDDGHGASAGDVSGCQGSDAYSSRSYGYSDGNASSYSSDSSGQNATACRDGYAASAEGNDVFAGSEETCQGSSDSHQYGSTSGSVSQSRCFNGFAVEGPQHVRLAEGDDSWRGDSCDGDNCTSGSSDWQGLTWTWPGAPVEGLQTLSVGLDPSLVLP